MSDDLARIRTWLATRIAEAEAAVLFPYRYPDEAKHFGDHVAMVTHETRLELLREMQAVLDGTPAAQVNRPTL